MRGRGANTRVSAALCMFDISQTNIYTSAIGDKYKLWGTGTISMRIRNTMWRSLPAPPSGLWLVPNARTQTITNHFRQDPDYLLFRRKQLVYLMPPMFTHSWKSIGQTKRIWPCLELIIVNRCMKLAERVVDDNVCDLSVAVMIKGCTDLQSADIEPKAS